MAKALTILDLFNYCKREIKKGHADYKVFISNDEEGNGFHALWYEGQTPKEIEEKYDANTRKYFENINQDISILEDKEKAIYLG